MLNLFTILVFLFVLLGVLGLRAFTNRARREEMVRERLTELLTQVEEEAKSVAPVEYPDESVDGGQSLCSPRGPYCPIVW